MSNWKLIVDFALPPPLVLTVLILLPLPLVMQKGFLIITERILFFPLVNDKKLVHVMLIVTGVAFIATSVHLVHLNRSTKVALTDATLTPNQRTMVLARKWREERNFWIACLTFLLWGLLYRFYALMREFVRLKDRVRELEAQHRASSAAPAAAAGPATVVAAASEASGVPKAVLEMELPQKPADKKKD